MWDLGVQDGAGVTPTAAPAARWSPVVARDGRATLQSAKCDYCINAFLFCA